MESSLLIAMQNTLWSYHAFIFMSNKHLSTTDYLLWSPVQVVYDFI